VEIAQSRRAVQDPRPCRCHVVGLDGVLVSHVSEGVDGTAERVGYRGSYSPMPPLRSIANAGAAQ
jgi:hypothetical protein